MFELIAGVLRGTPVWVFALFVYLIWMGARRLRPTTQSLARIGIVPLIFIAWGLLGLFRHSGEFELVATHWIVGAFVGIALGAARRVELQIDPGSGLIRQPASVIPLLRNSTIFIAHYGLNIGAAMHPASHEQWMSSDVYVSGASAGYFIGWALRFATSYRRAARTDSTPAVC